MEDIICDTVAKSADVSKEPGYEVADIYESLMCQNRGWDHVYQV